MSGIGDSRNSATIYVGDCLDSLKSMPENSVQTCVTSPPYWGLRDYGHDGQIGQEPTPEAYVQTMVDVFREVRRVLHDSGTVWLNIGDSYYNYRPGAGQKVPPQTMKGGGGGGGSSDFDECARRGLKQDGLKEKDLCLIPWRLAIALQADGWWVRSVICWSKKSCMPESVTDRPTNSWEPIFLLAKNSRYFYDAEAVKEKAGTGSDLGLLRGKAFAGGAKVSCHAPSIKARQDAGIDSRTAGDGTRNQRNVWHLGPEPYRGAHFATFPTEIPRRAVLAGTTAHGCCPKCFAPWTRVIEKGNPSATGWSPGCECRLEPVPCTVLDPFMGSGTTGAVALRLGRNFVGCELNPEYVNLAESRLRGEAPPVSESEESEESDDSVFDLFGGS